MGRWDVETAFICGKYGKHGKPSYRLTPSCVFGLSRTSGIPKPARIKGSRYAAEEREAQLNRLGDVLQVMEKHIDFKGLATEIDQAFSSRNSIPQPKIDDTRAP